MRSVAEFPRRLVFAMIGPAVWLGFLLLVAWLRAALVCHEARADGILRWRNLVTAALIVAALVCSSELIRFGTSGEDLLAAFNMRHSLGPEN